MSKKNKKTIAIPMNLSGKGALTINNVYVDYVTKSGYNALLVNAYNTESIKFAVNQCDGLLLTGGIDIDPIYYGYDNIKSFYCDIERDDAHRAVLSAFLKKKKPVFAICRGMQLVMLEYLKENKSDCYFEQDIKHHNPIRARGLKRETNTHSVMFKYSGRKRFARIFVNSTHHQAFITDDLAILSKELNVVAYTNFGLKEDKSFILEGVSFENFKGSKVLCVQWHPEDLKDYKLLKGFFK